MSAPAPLTIDLGPDWMVAEMPPGYRNRVAEIQRLTADLQAMTRVGRLLYELGPGLGDAVRDLFSTLAAEAQAVEGTGGTGIAVRLDAWKRLLLHVSSDPHPVPRKSPEIAHVFQMLHEQADEHDHVVFVTNAEPGTPPASRGDALTPDAHEFLTRMGVSHVTAATLFTLWKLSLEEPERAREQVQRLHAHAGGTFQLPASARLI